MKFLITGGAGFIGSCLIWKLNTEGFEDIIVADELGTSYKWKNLVGKHYQNYIGKSNLFDYLDENNHSSNLDVIIHFGACTSTTEKDTSYLKENNYLYSKRLAEWALANKKRFLYASSAATYGSGDLGYSDNDELTLKLKPLNPYGESKQLFDEWVIKNRLQEEFVGFKFFNVYGPNEYHKGDMRSMVHKGYEQIKSTGKIRLFKSYRPEYKDGEQKRDFIYVKDAVEIICYFIKNPDKKGICNVGTGKARSWNELAYALFSAMGVEPNIEYFDMPKDLRDQYQYHTEADLTKLKKTGCRCKFTDLKKAVKDYVGYLDKGVHL